MILYSLFMSTIKDLVSANIFLFSSALILKSIYLAYYRKLSVGLVRICSVFAAKLDMVVKYLCEASVI